MYRISNMAEAEVERMFENEKRGEEEEEGEGEGREVVVGRSMMLKVRLYCAGGTVPVHTKHKKHKKHISHAQTHVAAMSREQLHGNIAITYPRLLVTTLISSFVFDTAERVCCPTPTNLSLGRASG